MITQDNIVIDSVDSKMKMSSLVDAINIVRDNSIPKEYLPEYIAMTPFTKEKMQSSFRINACEPDKISFLGLEIVLINPAAAADDKIFFLNYKKEIICKDKLIQYGFLKGNY